MYDKCYFCLDQLPKLKKEIHSKLFRKFWRSRGTKEPAYITVHIRFGKDMRIKRMSTQTTYINMRIMHMLKIYARMRKTATAYAHIRMKLHNPQLHGKL